MNNKFTAVIKREYFTRVRTKGFIIGTISFPVVLVFLFGGIFLFASFFAPSTKQYVVIDETGHVFSELAKILPDTLKNGEKKYIFEQTSAIAEEREVIINELRDRINRKEIDGYLIIPENVLETRQVKFSARNVSDFDEINDLQRGISRILGNLRLENIGLSPAEIRQEMNLGRISLISSQVTAKGEVSKHGVSNFLLTYLLSYMILIFIMTYGQTVTRSVIEEKSQRITETIISSLKPSDLMIGKMIGICLLGITQLLIIGGFIYFISLYAAPLFQNAGVQMPKLMIILQNLHFSPIVFAFFIVFFLMGFMLYAALFAAVGSMVNTADEGQQFLFPIVILSLVGFFIMISVAKNPDTAAALWASLIPFFTPTVMFARIAVTSPVIPISAYISLFTMAVSIYLIIKLVAKIYRVGILMYGKKPSLKETLKWIRYK